MTAKDDRKNAEGYNDPTAYNAIKNVEQEQDKDTFLGVILGISTSQYNKTADKEK